MLASFISAFTFILAQEEGGGDGGSSASSYTFIIYIVLFIGIFYFLLIRPGQKQKRQHQDLVQSIHKGDEVMTAGGIFGTVTQVRDDYIMVEIAKKTEIKLSRNSIARRVSVEAEVEEPEAEEETSGEASEETQEK